MAISIVVEIVNRINFHFLSASSASTASTVYTTPNDVMKNPDEAPDSGYIAIVTIVVATLLVLVLTVVSISIHLASGKF
jgi:hypothetical protein